MTALEDQQLGGLIMWIPACLVYVAAGLALFAAWLRESERRMARREQRLGVESLAQTSEVPRGTASRCRPSP